MKAPPDIVVRFAPNLLNQHGGRNNPSAITVIGLAATNTTVTVNLNSTVRNGEYWWGEAIATNSSFPAYVGITNVAVIKGGGTNGTDLVSTNTGALLWAESSETFTNDLDGNLTADSLRTYTWDGENRLIRKEIRTAVPLDFRRKLEMIYDAGNRRIGQTVSMGARRMGRAYHLDLRLDSRPLRRASFEPLPPLSAQWVNRCGLRRNHRQASAFIRDQLADHVLFYATIFIERGWPHRSPGQMPAGIGDKKIFSAISFLGESA